MLPLALVGEVQPPGGGVGLLTAAADRKSVKASRIFLQMRLWPLKNGLTDWFAPVVIARGRILIRTPFAVRPFVLPLIAR
jgi:hypothetical protein